MVIAIDKAEKILYIINKKLVLRLTFSDLWRITRSLEAYQAKQKRRLNSEEKAILEIIDKDIKKTAGAVRQQLRFIKLPYSLRSKFMAGEISYKKAYLIARRLKQRIPTEVAQKLKNKAVKVMLRLHKKLKLQFENEKRKGSLPFNAEQIAQLIHVARPQLGLMILTAALTGARISEVIDIKLKYCNFTNKFILIGGPYSHAKNSKEGKLILPQELIDILETWTNTLQDTKQLWPNNQYKDKPLTRAGIESEFIKVRRNAGLLLKKKTKSSWKYKYSFHGLRKFYCCYIVNTTKNVYVAKELLRHTKIETTIKCYADYSFKQKVEDVAKIFSNFETTENTETTETTENTENTENTISNNIIKQTNTKPFDLLDLKLVNGEISIKEYEERKETLNKSFEKGNYYSDYIG